MISWSLKFKLISKSVRGRSAMHLLSYISHYFTIETNKQCHAAYPFRNVVYNVRSSFPEVFYRKGVLRNFSKLTGKHLFQSLFFNKVAGVRPETLLKKRLWHRCFPVNLAKFLRTPFHIEHLRWLLLVII